MLAASTHPASLLSNHIYFLSKTSQACDQAWGKLVTDQWKYAVVRIWIDALGTASPWYTCYIDMFYTWFIDNRKATLWSRNVTMKSTADEIIMLT